MSSARIAGSGPRRPRDSQRAGACDHQFGKSQGLGQHELFEPLGVAQRLVPVAILQYGVDGVPVEEQARMGQAGLEHRLAVLQQALALSRRLGRPGHRREQRRPEKPHADLLRQLERLDQQRAGLGDMPGLRAGTPP